MATMRSGSLHRTVELGVLLLCSVVTWGCASVPRHAVPRTGESRAMVPGMPGVRFWGDVSSPELERWLADGIDRERAYLHTQGIEELPEASYLALSGGGADGAFGAGVLCGWTEHGDRPAFRMVTGISTGALIAPFAFVGPDYDHVLREVYTTLATRDIAMQRSLLDGLTSDAIYDNAPLRRLIEKHVDEAFLARIAEEHRKGRGLILGTTNMDTQRPVIWAMGAIAASGHPDALRLFRDVMIASASIPGVFPPVMVRVEADGTEYDEMHADGGTAAQVFLYPASFSVKKFAEEHHAERDRTVYVIRNARLAPEHAEVPRRTLAIAQRAVSTLIKTQGVGDLYRIYLGCVRDHLSYRLAYIPEDFANTPAEMFDPPYMKALFDLGYQRGHAGYPWATAPPGFEPPKTGE